MVAWEKVEIGDSALEDAIDALGESEAGQAAITALEAIADTAGVISDVADIVLQALAGDGVTTALNAILTATDQLVEDLTKSDVYLFPLLPASAQAILRPYTISQALADFTSGLNDTMDADRPVFSDVSAHAAITIVAGANNWIDFTRILELLGELFDGTEFNKWKRFGDIRFDVDEYEPKDRSARGGEGTPWNWTRAYLLDYLPPLKDALESLRDWVQRQTQAARGILAGINEALELLQDRIAYIQALADEIQKLANFLLNLKELVPHCYAVITLSERGGTTTYADMVVNAQNQPQFELTAGVTIAAFTGNPQAAYDSMSTVGSLLGLQAEKWEAAGRQIGLVVGGE